MTDPVARAAAALRAGGVVAYPTEAVYGLGCDPRNQAAVERILDLKGRPTEKGLILIAAEFDQVTPFLAPLPEAMRATVLATWPGPITWLIPAATQTPPWLRGTHDTLAVRVTAFAPAAALCRAAGMALVSTSANRSGEAPARTAAEVRAIFGTGLDDVLEGPCGGRERPSEIRDARTGAVIRPG